MQHTLSVIGSGSWGTAQVKLLSENGNRVYWYVRRPEEAAFIKSHGFNRNYLSDAKLNLDLVTPVSDINQAIAAAEGVFLVVPAAFLAQTLEGLRPAALANKWVASGIKGIVPGQNLLVTDYLERYLGVPPSRQAILAGPCHAEEIAMAKQSYLTIGAFEEQTAVLVARLLQNEFLTCTPSSDLYGLEFSAILKNIVAIACGIAHGLRYGDNFLAVLVSNALKEIEDFLTATCPLPGRRLTASGYAGDVLVTAYSQFSRNRTFGTMLGRGYSVQAAHLEMNMVAEGYYASKCIAEMPEKQAVSMPVIDTTHRILYEKMAANLAFADLAAILR